MNIIAIDPSSTSLGWATREGHGTIVASGDRPTRLRQMLDALYQRVIPRGGVVIYYTPFARGADATRCQWGIAGVIEAVANLKDATVLDISEGTVRSFHGAPRSVPRPVLKAWALEKAQELGFDVRNDDEADAVLLLLYAERKLNS